MSHLLSKQLICGLHQQCQCELLSVFPRPCVPPAAFTCRAIMSYLQVICEQHRLVEQHLDKFASPSGSKGAAKVGQAGATGMSGDCGSG